MKNLLCLFLASSLAFSLAGCGGQSAAGDSTAASGTAAADTSSSAAAQSTSVEIAPEDITMEDQILLEEANVKVTAKDWRYDPDWGRTGAFYFTLGVENHSGHALMLASAGTVGTGSFTGYINRFYSTMNFWDAETQGNAMNLITPDGETGECEIFFTKYDDAWFNQMDDTRYTGLTFPDEILLDIDLFIVDDDPGDPSNYDYYRKVLTSPDARYLDSVPVELVTSASGACPIEYTLPDTILYEDDDVLITADCLQQMCLVVNTDSADYYSFDFLCQNKSDGPISVEMIDNSVNGFVDEFGHPLQYISAGLYRKLEFDCTTLADDIGLESPEDFDTLECAFAIYKKGDEEPTVTTDVFTLDRAWIEAHNSVLRYEYSA